MLVAQYTVAPATQAIAGPHSVGSFNRPHLRNFSAGVSDLRWQNASYRFHYRRRATQEDTKTTSAWIHSPLASPLHAGRSSGMTVMRRWAEGVETAPDWDMTAQLAPHDEADQRIN